MSVITWDVSIGVAAFEWRQFRNDIDHRSPWGAQSQEVAAPWWEVLLSTSNRYDADSGPLKSLLMRLNGKINQLALHDVMRPAPLGTMRGAMTLAAGIAQGATSMQVSAGVGQAGKTLVAGDYLGIGSGVTQQVVMLTANATANGSGDVTVNFMPAARSAHTLGATVTWDAPKALFRAVETPAKWGYKPGVIVDGVTLHFMESPAP